VTAFKASDRMKDELVRQKAVLMQELQHRVANSLQIIASVLMQSARKVQSEETRSHLAAAHGRVMAVGDVQKLLAASELGTVEIGLYLGRLCHSLSASMIHDAAQLSIEVRADHALVDADTSISIGLIVTELVINSLKHAFPEGRKGRIDVAYSVHGPNWTLTVSDNGVGMPKGEPAEAGLGTSIVRALAEQLGAIIHVVDARPGTTVSVAHLKLSVVDGVVAV